MAERAGDPMETPTSEPRDDWSEEPPRRRGVPRWVWITCGSGCLLLVIALSIAAFAGWKLVEQAQDPEKQWARLEELLPFDERPADLQPEFGIFLGPIQQIHLRDRRTGLRGVLYASEDRDFVEQWMQDEPRGTFLDLGVPKDPTHGELELQGRTVPVMRYRSIGGKKPELPGLRLDLGQQRGSWVVVELDGAAPPTDEEVRSFFEPFDVWRER